MTHIIRSRPTLDPDRTPVRTGKGIYNSADQVIIDRMIRRGSDAFGAAFAAAGLWFDDHPAFAPDPTTHQRRGIMAGRDPGAEAMIAARVAMSERSRMAVTIGNMRGMI